MRLVFDIETDGLLDTLTQIHCIVIKDIDSNEVFSFPPADVEQGLDMLYKADRIIGHNIINFDLPAIEKVYPTFETKAKVSDTLVLSRVIKADQTNNDFSSLVLPRKLNGSHSLKAWGLRLGVLKGEFGETTDWSKWSEDMQKYCEQDVEVTHKLWMHLAPEKWSKESIIFEHQIAEVCNRIGSEGCHSTKRKQVISILNWLRREPILRLNFRLCSSLGKCILPLFRRSTTRNWGMSKAKSLRK